MAATASCSSPSDSDRRSHASALPLFVFTNSRLHTVLIVAGGITRCSKSHRDATSPSPHPSKRCRPSSSPWMKKIMRYSHSSSSSNFLRLRTCACDATASVRISRTTIRTQSKTSDRCPRCTWLLLGLPLRSVSNVDVKSILFFCFVAHIEMCARE